jgi:hypothetical protein
VGGKPWPTLGYEFTGRVSTSTYCTRDTPGTLRVTVDMYPRSIFSPARLLGGRGRSSAKETNRLLVIGTWLGGPVSCRSWLVETRRAIVLCPFFNRGMYGAVTGRFINFSSTVPSSSPYQCRAKSAVFAKGIRGAGQGMGHSDGAFVSSLMSPSLEGFD